eukprot:COSAG01_NODE_4053_length_5391_cov_293.922336_3_plen_69_part_00
MNVAVPGTFCATFHIHGTTAVVVRNELSILEEPPLLLTCGPNNGLQMNIGAIPFMQCLQVHATLWIVH